MKRCLCCFNPKPEEPDVPTEMLPKQSGIGCKSIQQGNNTNHVSSAVNALTEEPSTSSFHAVTIFQISDQNKSPTTPHSTSAHTLTFPVDANTQLILSANLLRTPSIKARSQADSNYLPATSMGQWDTSSTRKPIRQESMGKADQNPTTSSRY